MNKKEFLDLLAKKLSHIPDVEKDDIINYYNELIEDKVDNTYKSEEEVIADLGDINDIVKKLGRDNNKIVYDEPNIEKDNSSFIKGIIILVLLFPVWITVFSVLFWLIIGVIAGGIGIIVSGIVMGVSAVILTTSNLTMGLFWLGVSLLLVGIGLILMPIITKFVVWTIKQITRIFKYVTSDGKRRLGYEN